MTVFIYLYNYYFVSFYRKNNGDFLFHLTRVFPDTPFPSSVFRNYKKEPRYTMDSEESELRQGRIRVLISGSKCSLYMEHFFRINMFQLYKQLKTYRIRCRRQRSRPIPIERILVSVQLFLLL